MTCSIDLEPDVLDHMALPFIKKLKTQSCWGQPALQKTQQRRNKSDARRVKLPAFWHRLIWTALAKHKVYFHLQWRLDRGI